jgi:hypothetical protein
MALDRTYNADRDSNNPAIFARRKTLKHGKLPQRAFGTRR